MSGEFPFSQCQNKRQSQSEAKGLVLCVAEGENQFLEYNSADADITRSLETFYAFDKITKVTDI